MRSPSADSQTYNGDSVYTLNVPGDDTETPTQIEGGIAGDTIVFRVDGQEADQTATWNEGSLNELNLTVSSPSPTATPTATPTSSPTATQTTPPTSTPTHTPTVPPTPSIIHVKADASGASDGSSWANAYTDLQAALAVATAGDEIWVAAGTYKPSDTNRAASFHLKNGVAIYGGFNGTETSRDKRDWEANPTILSGDLNGDDNDNINTTEPTRAENSLHVVIAHSTDGSALLDGFTITGGNCNEGTPDGDGGGMYILSGSPTLQNLIFMDNSAGDGGALSTENGHPTLTNVTFSNNFANDDGGAISNHGGRYPTIMATCC